jgi:hypothetical protein
MGHLVDSGLRRCEGELLTRSVRPVEDQPGPVGPLGGAPGQNVKHRPLVQFEPAGSWSEISTSPAEQPAHCRATTAW